MMYFFMTSNVNHIQLVVIGSNYAMSYLSLKTTVFMITYDYFYAHRAIIEIKYFESEIILV